MDIDAELAKLDNRYQVKRLMKSYNCECIVCGNGFTSTRSTAKYCSKACGKKNRKKINQIDVYELKRKQERAKNRVIAVAQEYGKEFILEALKDL